MENQIKALADLEKHHIGRFPATLLELRETIEETLTHFEADDRFDLNRHVVVRTHELYELDPEVIEQLRQALVRNSDFVHVEIVQEPSDIGVASKVLARDRTGQTILYDGVMWRVTESVCEGHFALEEIDHIAGWPGNPGDIVDSLQHSLKEVLQELPEGWSVYSFYTASNVNWEEFGLRREGDAKLRLGFEGFRGYSVYIGDRESTLQMIANDLHVGKELRRFQGYFDKQRAALDKVKDTTIAELNGLLEPLLRLGRKQNQWNSVKRSLRSLNRIHRQLAKGGLLVDSVSGIVEERVAFYYMWQSQRPCSGFFAAKVKDGKLEDLSTGPEEPIYVHDFRALKQKIAILREELGIVLTAEKDLLTAFQTEFSLYAVWLAVIAFVTSLVSIVIAVVWN